MSAAKYPLGIQDFGELISGGYTYIDKTESIYKLITQGKPYFLSRPRRFGKSLLISTLEALFSGKRELFKGLWLDKSDWDWKTYPIIRLDMSRVDSSSPEYFASSLLYQLQEIAKAAQIILPEGLPISTVLDSLITQLSHHGQVVVLVDEYDKPLIDRLDDLELAVKTRDILRQFYAILKARDANLKFVFLTGVTKFSKVSVFSGLNNLVDISMNDEYSALLGYTKQELNHYFSDDIEILAKARGLSIDDCYETIKNWYNGYQFSEEGQLVYNPSSVLNVLHQKRFRSYWFETGTPTFLIKLIKDREFDVVNLEQLEVGSESFSSFEIEDIPTLPLLYQAGYLTIKEYKPVLNTYRLGYPNREVSQAFSESLLTYFSLSKAESADHLNAICHNLLADKWDDAQFFSLLEKLLGLIPYDLYLKQEKHYHSLFYLIFKLAGIKIDAEVHTQHGRADIIMETKNKIIIFEFKLDKTAQAAIDQIKEKFYYTSYLDRNLPIFLVGINFDGKIRGINEKIVERLKPHVD